VAMDWSDISLSKKASPMLRYNFAHDLESLWWVMVWIIIVCIKDGWMSFSLIFAVLGVPSEERRDLFLEDDSLLLIHLTRMTHQVLRDCNAPIFLTVYNEQLCTFYEQGNRQDISSYQGVYKDVWLAMETFIPKVSDVSMKLEDPHLRPRPSPQSFPGDLEVRKRSRSMGASDKNTPEPGEEGPSRKKSKVSRDVFGDISGEDSRKDGTD
jgi:hypothetical protein